LAEVIAVAAASRNLTAIGSAQTAHCVLAAARGDVAKTIEPLEALLAAVKAAGVLQVVQHLKLQLGRAKLLIGDPVAAADLLDGTGEIESLRHSYIYRLSRAYYAEALAAQGALSQAEAVLDQMEGVMAERGEAGTLAHCWIVRAKIALAAGDSARAKIAYEHALQRAAALSMRRVCETCEAGFVEIASRQNQTKPILD
jgi:tetratricopeptide (TPR) repeat protein